MARKTARNWLDPRLLIGLGLVAASVAGTVAVVQGVGQTESVWAADDTLMPGDVIHDGDLVAVDVRLGTTTDHYLSADESVVGLVVGTPIQAGELVPALALGAGSSSDLAAIVVAVPGPLPQGVSAGAAVDVWVATALEQQTFGPPEERVDDALVVGVVTPDGLIADRSIVNVEILVPRAAIGALIESIANGDVIALVPTLVDPGVSP